MEDTGLKKGSSKIQSLVDTYGKWKRTNFNLKEKIISLIKELNEERSRHAKQDEMMAKVIRMTWSLSEESPHFNKLFQPTAPSLSLQRVGLV